MACRIQGCVVTCEGSMQITGSSLKWGLFIAAWIQGWSHVRGPDYREFTVIRAFNSDLDTGVVTFEGFRFYREFTVMGAFHSCLDTGVVAFEGSRFYREFTVIGAFHSGLDTGVVTFEGSRLQGVHCNGGLFIAAWIQGWSHLRGPDYREFTVMVDTGVATPYRSPPDWTSIPWGHAWKDSRNCVYIYIYNIYDLIKCHYRYVPTSTLQGCTPQLFDVHMWECLL